MEVLTIFGFLLNRRVILYGLALAGLLLLLKWLEWQFIVMNYAVEIYGGAIAVLFTGLGVWLAVKLARPKLKTVIIEKEVPAPPASGPLDARELARLGLSPRELDVLKGMAEGLSNQEIAARLFVSLNTVKTHSSKIFEKMEVRRRTQAIDKAKKLRII
jgi:DNA-binding CsgD family transcriptional regulator